jgi:hypothetical protein
VLAIGRRPLGILVSTVHSMLKVNNLIGLTLRAATLEYYLIYLLDSTAQCRRLAAHRLDLRVRLI